MNQHFSIATRLELVALGLELFAQLYEVEDLPVENHPDLAIGAGHRLHAVFGVNHGQSGVPQNSPTQILNTLLIHTTVFDAVDHLPDVVFRHARSVDHTCYSTHGNSLIL